MWKFWTLSCYLILFRDTIKYRKISIRARRHDSNSVPWEVHKPTSYIFEFQNPSIFAFRKQSSSFFPCHLHLHSCSTSLDILVIFNFQQRLCNWKGIIEVVLLLDGRIWILIQPLHVYELGCSSVGSWSDFIRQNPMDKRSNKGKHFCVSGGEKMMGFLCSDNGDCWCKSNEMLGWVYIEKRSMRGGLGKREVIGEWRSGLWAKKKTWSPKK